MSRLTNAHVAKLHKHFGYWQAQSCKITLAEMKAMKDVPILHATGDHSKYNSEWFHTE